MLNAVVQCPYCTFTVYGNRSTSDFPTIMVIVQENTPLTIADGATLTVPQGESISILSLQSLTNRGTIVNQGEITISSDSLGTPDLGSITNDGLIAIYMEKNSSGEEIPAFIKALNLTGGGSVVTQYWDNDAKDNVLVATYTNSGVKQLDPAGTGGTLDLSADADGDADHWNDQGYKWENVETDKNGNITGGTLTLAEGFNAETVILPGNGAVVEANGGVSVAASGGVDGTVTVNGTLTARADGGAAVLTGKISVGPSGRLEVYGNKGVQLGGVNKGSGPDSVIDFTNAFLLAPGGRFTGECENSVILASKYSGAEFEEGLRAEDIISIPGGYLPQGLAPEFSGNRKELIIPGGGPFNISADNVPVPPGPSEGSGGSGGYGGGYSDDRDDGDSGISSYPVTVERADHGKIISSHARASGGGTVTLAAAPDGELAFTDAEQIGAHAREALRWAVGTGVMNGKTGGALDPKGLATRAQAAQMLKNFL